MSDKNTFIFLAKSALKFYQQSPTPTISNIIYSEKKEIQKDKYLKIIGEQNQLPITLCTDLVIEQKGIGF